MATTPLWVPLAVAGLAVLGTLAGVVFTQVWNARLEARRWARETERLREAQARDDLNRTYEHRRAAYADFLQEFERLQGIYVDSHREPIDPPSLNDRVFNGLTERHSTLWLYGTYEAEQAAGQCLTALKLAAIHPENGGLQEDVYEAGSTYLLQVRKDLGVPEWIPAKRSDA
jgi:hypothetical protein